MTPTLQLGPTLLNKNSFFSEVFQREKNYVSKRRMRLKGRDVKFTDNPKTLPTAETNGSPSPNKNEKSAVHELQTDALNDDLCGLAISGGGIRSATFGLGVLQGLAKATLLSRFDYLSTVSGGGYIGSFFSKWISEGSFEECESALAGKNSVVSQASDDDQEFLRIQSRSTTAKEISHLRQYSNYLAPTTGLLSLDSWLLIAIYVRNLFLNQAVLFLAAVALVQLIRFLAEIYCFAGKNLIGISLPWYVILLLIFTCVQVTLMWLFRNSTDIPDKVAASSKNSNASRWWTTSRVSAVGLSLYVSLFSKFDNSTNWGDPVLWWIIGAQTMAFALLAALSHKQDGVTKSIGNVLAGAAGGFLGGLIAALMLEQAAGTVQTNLIFSVPIIILAFVISEMIYVGLAGLLLEELDREWWSSVNSRLLLFSFGWIAVVFIVIFSPWLFGYVIFEKNWASFWAMVAGSAGTITVVAGILSAGSSSTNGGKQKLREFLAALAPAAFLVLLVCLVSIAVRWLSYELYVSQECVRSQGFLKLLEKKQYLANLQTPTLSCFGMPALLAIPISSLIALVGACLLSERVGVNTFSLHNMYANRLIRCYLGATTKNRIPNRLTNFDPKDDIELSKLDKSATNHRLLGPLHIINGALNRSSSKSNLDLDQEEYASLLLNRNRRSESFVFTPLDCGSESTGYRPTKEFGGKLKLGHAVAVSGAAVSPNMGYHSSPVITALLTVFNLRLGAWFGNPRSKNKWKNSNPTGWRLLFNELKGNTNTEDEHVYVSDGGHFENMGVYELLRRRCRFIVAVDADSARNLHENIGRLVRMARIDFGVRIELDSTPITPDENGVCKAHVVVGRIHYGDVHRPCEEQPPHDPSFSYENNQGIIVWIALAVTGDEPADISNYRAMNKDFPYRTTGDQFFDENEFESYRELGEHSVESILRQCTLPVEPENAQDPTAKDLNTFAFMLENKRHRKDYRAKKKEVLKFVNKTSTKSIFKSIFDKWLVQPQVTSEFIELNKDYVAILAKLRLDPALDRLAASICGIAPATDGDIPSQNQEKSERLMIGEMMKLLENTWVVFDFQNGFLHPTYRGWLNVFRQWTGNDIFEKHWFDKTVDDKTGIQYQFNPDFRRFVEAVRRIENSSNADTYDMQDDVEDPFIRMANSNKGGEQ